MRRTANHPIIKLDTETGQVGYIKLPSNRLVILLADFDITRFESEGVVLMNLEIGDDSLKVE